MARLMLCWVCLAAWSAAAQTNLSVRSELIRAECIQGRRHICGRVLQVAPAGLVVDSGYSALLQPPFNHGWVTPADVNLVHPPAQIELTAPDSMAIGLVFLTDIPKRPVAHRYDYVSMIGYPAGQYTYVPVTGVSNTIRRFSAGLETAVRLNLP